MDGEKKQNNLRGSKETHGDIASARVHEYNFFLTQDEEEVEEVVPKAEPEKGPEKGKRKKNRNKSKTFFLSE